MTPAKRIALWLKRYAPSRERLTKSRWLRPVAHYIGNPNVWHFNRHSVARGVALGLFLGFAIPIGFQIILAALVAVSARANIAALALFTSVSNPASMFFIYPAQIKVGDWLLGHDTTIIRDGITMTDLAKELPVPWIVGGVFLGTISAAVGFLTINFLWRYWVARRWQARLARRRRSA
ncbi:MAG: DUF2062 domain-containing protein [Pacificimonas sp.]